MAYYMNVSNFLCNGKAQLSLRPVLGVSYLQTQVSHLLASKILSELQNRALRPLLPVSLLLQL